MLSEKRWRQQQLHLAPCLRRAYQDLTSGRIAHSQTEVLLHPCIWDVEVHWASKEVLNKPSFKYKFLSANSPLAVNQGWHCFVQIMSSHMIQRLPLESETSTPYHQLKKGPPIREWLMFLFLVSSPTPAGGIWKLRLCLSDPPFQPTVLPLLIHFCF